MGHLEKLPGIPEPKADLLNERFGRGFHGQLRSVPLTLCLLTGPAGSADRRSHTCRKPDLLDQLCRMSIVDPETKRLAEAPPCLIQRPAVAVAPSNARHPCDPRAARVSLDDDAVSAFPFHCIHFFPKHGSGPARSRHSAAHWWKCKAN